MLIETVGHPGKLQIVLVSVIDNLAVEAFTGYEITFPRARRNLEKIYLFDGSRHSTCY